MDIFKFWLNIDGFGKLPFNRIANSFHITLFFPYFMNMSLFFFFFKFVSDKVGTKQN